MPVVSRIVSRVSKAKAAQLCQQGLECYQNWDTERAIEAFETATALDDTNPDYFLHLARTYVRLGDYDAMRRALGGFIHLETDQRLIDRFEALFGSALDEVEKHLTDVMTGRKVPLQIVGAALHMWVEFRVAMGRNPINTVETKALAWAAALDYTVRKVNFFETDSEQIAAWYQIPPKAVKYHHRLLVETLDIMPCDYRYFRGSDNPLDKLVEAALILEDLEDRFYNSR